MRKFILAITVMIICIITAVPIFAAFENPSIVDDAGYLTDDQLEELSKQLESIRKEYDFDVAIYTEETMSGVDAMSTADDIYDYSGYGGGDNDSGILLYVSTEPRTYWFTTHGDGEVFFNKNGLAYLERNILPYLKENDYYSAFKTYVEHADELLDMAAKGEPFNKKQYTMQHILIVIGGALIIPPVLAFTFLKRKLAMMNTAVKENYAANYMKPNSMKLDVSRDIFLYSTVTKTEKPKSDSGSHTSSSGRSHGGTGGNY